MKIKIKKDVKALDAWKKEPHGLAVIVLSNGTVLQGAATGAQAELVRVPANLDAAARKLERICAAHDERRAEKPRLVVVSAAVRDDERNAQFFRRATLVVEV